MTTAAARASSPGGIRHKGSEAQSLNTTCLAVITSSCAARVCRRARDAAAKQIAAAFAAAGRSFVEALTACRLVHHYDWEMESEKEERRGKS